MMFFIILVTLHCCSDLDKEIESIVKTKIQKKKFILSGLYENYDMFILQPNKEGITLSHIGKLENEPCEFLCEMTFLVDFNGFIESSIGSIVYYLSSINLSNAYHHYLLILEEINDTNESLIPFNRYKEIITAIWGKLKPLVRFEVLIFPFDTIFQPLIQNTTISETIISNNTTFYCVQVLKTKQRYFISLSSKDFYNEFYYTQFSNWKFNKLEFDDEKTLKFMKKFIIGPLIRGFDRNKTVFIEQSTYLLGLKDKPMCIPVFLPFKDLFSSFYKIERGRHYLLNSFHKLTLSELNFFLYYFPQT